MNPWFKIVAISAGGALGANARYWLGVWMVRRLGADLPWATLTINVSGAFVIGLLATVLLDRGASEGVRLFLLVGFLGGYTTFSTFALEAFALWDGRARGVSLAYMVGSVGAGLLAVALGIAIGRGLTPSPLSIDKTRSDAPAVGTIDPGEA